MTGSSFVINSGDIVDVSISEQQPFVTVEVLPPPAWGVVTVAGPQGPQGNPGQTGPSYSGVGWFFGEGEPNTVIGSKPGDFYMDTSTGTIYKLGD